MLHNKLHRFYFVTAFQLNKIYSIAPRRYGYALGKVVAVNLIAEHTINFDKLNPAMAKSLFNKCIQKGLYFHTDFTVSAQHDNETLDSAVGKILEAAREVKAEVR